MSIFEQNREFYNRPIRLDEEQKKAPSKVLNEFFSAFRLFETKEHLAELLETVLTKETDHYMEASQRSSIMYFIERLEELIEASYLLNLKNRSRSS